VIKCFERSTVRELRIIRTTCPAVYVCDNANKYTYIRHGKTRNKKLIKEETILRKDGSSAGFNIALEKGRGKNYYTGDLNLVTHPSSNPAEQGLTSLSRQNMLLVVW